MIKVPSLTTSQSKNIERGIANLRRVAESKEGIDRGMKTDSMPKVWVSFPWGKAGASPGRKTHAEATEAERRKAFKGGYGVAHILAKRGWEGLDATWVLSMVAYTIALGSIVGTRRREDSTRVELEFKGFRVTLSHPFGHGDNKKPVNWLVTGFELEEGASEHSARLPSYAPGGQSINRQEGASSRSHSTPVPEDRKANPAPAPGKIREAPAPELRQKATGAATERKSNPEDGSMRATTGREKAAATSRGMTPKAPVPAARAKKPSRPTSPRKGAKPAAATKRAAQRKPGRPAHRLNPTDAAGLAKVWKAWTGAEPDQVMEIQVEDARKLKLPGQVVLLGRLSWLATKTGEEKRFGDSGPLMVTDAKASRIWLVSHRTHKIDLEPALIGYLARKPKFGDQGLVEYVHAFEGRAHAVMDGQVGALTGTFRITPAGLEG